MIRLVLWALGLAAAVVVVAAVFFRMVGDDPAVWHGDPMTATPGGAQNAVLVAPEGAAGEPDRAAPVWPVEPRALMEAFDAVALEQPRTERIAGDPAELHATYVQRSRIMGFPDYVSVKALPAEGGATLAIHSRSRYGRSDLGVNAARVSAWLDALDARLR